MPFNISDTENSLFLYLAGDLPLKDFEEWIYSAPQAEDWLGKSAYFDFILFDFKQPAADHELNNLIRNHVDPARFHTWRVWRLLQSLLEGTGDPVAAFESLYKMSCKGYDFLGNIGVQYLLGVGDIPKLEEKHLWEDRAFLRLRKMLDNHIQPLKGEIETLLHALESGKIEITGEQEYSIEPGLSRQLKRINGGKGIYIQELGTASPPPVPETTKQPPAAPAREPKPGKISYNEKWALTSQARDVLEQLANFGVDIYSTRGGNDYTILAPPSLSREQQDEVELLMNKLAKQVGGNLKYVDWYPHGWKFRIEPSKRKAP